MKVKNENKKVMREDVEPRIYLLPFRSNVKPCHP